VAAGSPGSRFYYARLTLLLALLFVVVTYAIHDVRSRHARKEWDHTLSVAIVVIRHGAVDDGSINALRDRAPALASRLESELHRYAPSAKAPFAFTVFGAIDGMQPAPTVNGDGLVALASYAWDLHRWTSNIDSRVNLVAGAYDSRIYVTAEPPTSKKHMIEGASEPGGRVGVVTVDLDALTIDYALAVIAHELFHTLDATDKYDEGGHTRVPDGLAEPDLAPRFPQRLVEVMAQGRPTSPTEEKTLDVIDELAVGPATAREVGWTQ
jgi:hypothetical protein